MSEPTEDPRKAVGSNALFGCPFCGFPGVEIGGRDDHRFVSCPTCGTEGPTWHNEHGAISLWNKRDPSSEVSQVSMWINPIPKPCEIACPKCGSLDVRREFRGGRSAWREVPKGFEDSYLYDARICRYFAVGDRINHHCRCCGFEWETAPLSEPNVRSDTQHEEAKPHEDAR